MAQVALATILLVTAGLMTRSLRALLRTDLGFRADGVVALHLTSIDTSRAARVLRNEFLTRVATMPGVSGVAMSGCVPYDLACFVTAGVRVPDDADASTRASEVELHTVSADYFRTMSIPITAGRPFVAEDTTVGRARVVISESAARRLFGTVAVVGKQITFSDATLAPMDIIGIARDVRFRSVDAAISPALYTLAGEDPRAPRLNATLFVRASTASGGVISAITRAVRDGGVPLGISNVRQLTDIVRAETSSTQFIATVLLGFAVSAALLAGLGVYGVIAYIITQRTREFGVRLVLGANGSDLFRAMVGRGASLVGAGVAIGVVFAVAASRLIASLLYGVGSFDAMTYVVVAAIVTTIGLFASFIPARRVARIDPSVALKI
jgi:predicted permease